MSYNYQLHGSMDEYWESRFKNEGEMWLKEPSDVALWAAELFKSARVHKILLPGFGYGRNARLFIEQGFEVTGIEISQSAIALARAAGINCTIHHGSVTSMPFDDQQYDAIFCYALIHLLNKKERKKFLNDCFDQLQEGGTMVMVMASTKMNMYGSGKYISKDRYEMAKGLTVFFYDDESVKKEFSPFGPINYADIEEPVKFRKGSESMKLKLVVCKKP